VLVALVVGWLEQVSACCSPCTRDSHSFARDGPENASAGFDRCLFSARSKRQRQSDRPSVSPASLSSRALRDSEPRSLRPRNTTVRVARWSGAGRDNQTEQLTARHGSHPAPCQDSCRQVQWIHSQRMQTSGNEDRALGYEPDIREISRPPNRSGGSLFVESSPHILQCTRPLLLKHPHHPHHPHPIARTSPPASPVALGTFGELQFACGRLSPRLPVSQ